MKNIFAGYAPDTQRKDKFGLNLQVTRSELNKLNKRPFFALYMQKFGVKINLANLIAAKIFALILPEELKNLAYTKGTTKQRRIFGKGNDRAANLSSLSKAVSIKKGSEEEGFTLRVPAFGFFLSEIEDILDSVYELPFEKINKGAESEEEIQIKEDKNTVVRGYYNRLYENLKNIIGNRSIVEIKPASLLATARGNYERNALSSVTRCYLQSVKNGSGVECFIELNFTAEDAKAFTGIETYGAIRNIDIYPVFCSWVQSGFREGPTTSVAISRISNALSADSINYAKTDEFNLVINSSGRILYIPKQCDNSREYEDSYIKACKSEENDEFTLANNKKDSLLKNKPILVDWTNAKYCYSNSSGNLEIVDLSQARTLTPTHVINVARRFMITGREVDRYLQYVDYTNLLPSVYANVKSEFEDAIQAINSLRDAENVTNGVSFYEVCTEPVYASLKRLLCDLGSALEKNPEKFYEKRSVLTGMHEIGLLSAINHYLSDEVIEDTKNADYETRSAAEYQGVDEDWTLPSIPLLNPIIKAMPHQYRVLNMLKDNPNFALLPVAAGGGKTPLAIMEILYQYKNTKNAPYIVLCPSMLVSQYAQEVSFFTNARVNVIPITTKVIKREGYERLQKIFEAAPRNTIVVASYSALAYQAHKIAYGVETIFRYPAVEFLRQFGFGFALCDESHQLKNQKTTRSKAVRALLSDIPVIRLASGTMAYNLIEDMVGQTSIMDPSIFGSVNDFHEEYGIMSEPSATGKRRFMGFLPGAEAKISKRLKQNVVVAGAARKEWAALLPMPITKYHFVELSPEQATFYDEFIQQAEKQIKESDAYKKAVEKIQRLKKAIEEGEASPEELEEFEERLGAELRPYLQKIERFILDPNSVLPIFPKDSSAKAEQVCKIIIEHEKLFKDAVSQEGQENTNKTIIFTENTISAKAIFDAAERHPELKGTGLLYKASEKVTALNEFNKNPKVRWMVGVETSINTGLNLQAASRIIRAEYPWAPGAIEQGDARILRPNKKGKDTRKNVFFDWVICDGTIDTLKISRLMAKSVQVGRFENPQDQRYQEIGQIWKDGELKNNVPIMHVSLENIVKKMRFISGFDESGEAGGLYPYYDAMKTLETLRRETFKEYRERHQDELNPDGTMKDYVFTVEENPKDAKLLRYIPYVEGTNLYKADELGLQRLDDYLMEYEAEEAEYQKTLKKSDLVDDSEATLEEIKADSPLNAAILGLKDETVWTEYGECAVVSISRNANKVRVRPLNSTEVIELTKDTVFVVTRKEVNPHELQNQILQSVGFKEYSDPEYVAPAGLKEYKKRGRKVDPEVLKRREEERKQKELLDLTIPMQLAVINGVLCLRYTVERGHDLAINMLQEKGFTLSNPYVSAKIKNKAMLDDFLRVVGEDLGYTMSDKKYDYSAAWIEIGRTMQRVRSKIQEDDTFVASDRIVTRIVNSFTLTNMLREEMRVTSGKIFRARPMFVSGVVYAVIPQKDKYPEGGNLRRWTSRKIPGFIWVESPRNGIFELYLEDKKETLRVLNELQNEGLNISNYEDLIKLLGRTVAKPFKSSGQIKQNPPSDTEGGGGSGGRRTLTRRPSTETKRPPRRRTL